MDIIAFLAEHGIVTGARVGLTSVPYHALGTVVAITSLDSVTVRWDDGRTSTETWVVLAPNGYILDAEDMVAPSETLTVEPSGLIWWSAAA
jgi:hypothetical protein